MNSTNAQGLALQRAFGGLQTKVLVILELSLERFLASSLVADVIGDHQNLGPNHKVHSSCQM